jgi:hypothetical protein
VRLVANTWPYYLWQAGQQFKIKTMNVTPPPAGG